MGCGGGGATVVPSQRLVKDRVTFRSNFTARYGAIRLTSQQYRPHSYGFSLSFEKVNASVFFGVFLRVFSSITWVNVQTKGGKMVRGSLVFEDLY